MTRRHGERSSVFTGDAACWTPAHRALWQRLEAHDFARPDQPLHFTARLAREHGWSSDEAAAAVREYRRFCFLAMVAGHAVTPSAEVDEVWHLHLTCTRDYWETFCPAVLGMPLHHEPTRGLREDRARHRHDYARTLASYEAWFRESPPARWWPGTRARFADARRWRRVDLAAVLLLPRPRWSWAVPVVAAAAVFAVAGRAMAQDLGPLDWNGPRFLLLYLGLLVAAIVAGVVIRRTLRGHTVASGGAPQDPIAVAWLAGGSPRAVDAAVTELMDAQQATWLAGQVTMTASPAAVRPGLSDFAYQAKRDGRPAVLLRTARTTLRHAADDLRRRGLLLTADDAARAAWLSALPLLAVASFGGAKIALGILRERPVAFLVILTVLTVIGALVFALKRPSRTRAGDQVLMQLQLQHARVARAPLSGEMAMAVALGGTLLLSGTAYAAYHQARAPAASSDGGSSSTGSSDGDSNSGDSGGSSGCGGCGGGGGGD